MATTSAPLLTIADVCERLRVRRSKVFQYIASGQLESLKIDGARRFTEQQLEAFIVSSIDSRAS